jgi:hypothetical protein
MDGWSQDNSYCIVHYGLIVIGCSVARAQRRTPRRYREIGGNEWSFLGSIIYRLVSFHSSTTKDEMLNVLDDPENSFKVYDLRDSFPFVVEAVLFR